MYICWPDTCMAYMALLMHKETARYVVAYTTHTMHLWNNKLYVKIKQTQSSSDFRLTPTEF